MKYTCILDDAGLTFSGTLIEIIGALDSYLKEEYGKYYIKDVQTNDLYTRAYKLSRPGEYMIVLSKNREIYCVIK